MRFNRISRRLVIWSRRLMSIRILRLKLKIFSIRLLCWRNKFKGSISLLTKRMGLLLIWKRISLIFILKLIITSRMSKRYNNPKIISGSINNRMITLKESWMDGKGRQRRLMPSRKELRVNFSNMSKKRIAYRTC